MKKLLVFMLCFVFLFTLVSASQESLGSFEAGNDIRLRQVCEDATYVNISSVTYPNGSIALSNVAMDSFGSGEYNYTFTDTDTVGTYSFNGISDGCDKTFAVFFDVNEGGVELSEGRSGLANGLLYVLLIFFVISLIGVLKVEDYKGKFALYWVTHVLFVLLTFAGWQIGVEGLLTSVALTGIFKILFYVSTVAMIPMIFLSLAWIFYIHTYNEHFEKLIRKGETPENAFRMADSKRKGWMHGK